MIKYLCRQANRGRIYELVNDQGYKNDKEKIYDHRFINLNSYWFDH